MIETTLQECLKVVIDNRGVTPHKRGTEWQDSGVPVLSANNIKTTGLQKMDEIRFIPEDVYPSWMKIPLEKGDIILTSEAPAGEVFYWDSDEKVALGQRLYGLKVKDEINSKYLKYYLQSSVGQKAIAQQQSGSTVMGIAASTFPQIAVRLPDRADQDAQAELLYTIDSKIANNNAICSNLEAMAKLLYDYWFVQFDFPDENGKPYKSSGGKMVWNDELKREIPEEWKAANVRQIAQILPGGTPSKAVNEYWVNGTLPFFGPTDYQNTVFQFDTKDHITESGLNACASSLFEAGTIIITARGSIGKLIIVGSPMAMNQSCYAFKPHNKNYVPYLYFFSKQIIEHLKVKSTGSVFKSIITDDIESSIMPVGSEEAIMLFCKKANPMFEAIMSLEKENQQLASLRDFLLPMLMNGQVKVG